MRVVLDYSPTLSDAGALLYLASNPEVELLAVTLAGTGESDCDVGVRTTRSLLAIAGRPNVPVGCGRDAPLVGHRDWPEAWRAEVNRWGDEMLPAVDALPALDAETLLVDTLTHASTPVTIVAVAPLTNLGAVLPAHPEFADMVDRIVIMGGAVAVPGNVEAAPAAEWNIYIDPEAARRVIATGIPITLVPLDATNDVPWTERLLRRLSTLEAPAATTVHQMAASRTTLNGFYLWDELAAVTAIRKEVVTTEQRAVRIDDDGTVVIDPNGVTINVAVHTDPHSATEEFLR
ncbi:MAG: nucleoside hydrolase, partial [Ilumatobacteraceae bacterium]